MGSGVLADAEGDQDQKRGNGGDDQGETRLPFAPADGVRGHIAGPAQHRQGRMDRRHTQPLDHQDDPDDHLQGDDVERYAAAETLPHEQDSQRCDEESNP